jgi:hypothetical protein
VCAESTSQTPEQASEELAKYYELFDEDDEYREPVIDPAVCEILWPYAKRAQEIVGRHWPSVNRLAEDLARRWRLKKKEIEARLPWAGQLTVR